MLEKRVMSEFLYDVLKVFIYLLELKVYFFGSVAFFVCLFLLFLFYFVGF